MILKINGQKVYDENTNTFYEIKPCVLHLEHSLYAISKWEEKHKRRFLDPNDKKDRDDVMDYIKCMCTDPEENIDPLVWHAISRKDIKLIEAEISEQRTATTINVPKNTSKSHSKEVITSELLYFYMAELNIPFECDKWHLSRLLMLIEVAALKRNPDGKKMPKSANISQRKALNASRKKRLGTRG